LPKGSWFAAGLVALLAALNFAPLPWNNNWLLMQAAPAFSLTDSEQALLRQAEEALARTDYAERVQEIMRQLQEGEINAEEAMAQLEALQEEMNQEGLDMAGVDAALDQVAEALSGSEELSQVAQALHDMDLADAAEQLQDLAEQASSEELQSMQQSLENAAESAQQGLGELGEDFQEAADNIAQKDEQGARDALAAAAKFLEDLAGQVQNQELSQQAAQQLKDFQKSLQERLQGEQQEQNAGMPQEGEGAEAGEPQPGGGTPSAEARSAGDQAGDPQESSDGGNQDTGQNPSGIPGETKNQPSAPLQLEVQLQQEGLTGLYDEEVEQEKIEETSKQERSRLDYRNVESELTPAQKDLLNQERIPWEYRNLIKSYFEAIKPPQEKE
jgi:hypothetical protein